MGYLAPLFVLNQVLELIYLNILHMKYKILFLSYDIINKKIDEKEGRKCNYLNLQIMLLEH